MARTTCTWALPVGVRSIIEDEARRRATTPSRVVEALLQRYLPAFVAESITETLAEPRDPELPMDTAVTSEADR
jgi:hypothetical protein